jgi:pimeloyl-ACP methyl ester carboxylesterase
LAPLSSVAILALAPDNAPNRGLPDKAFGQYRAILVTTRYFETAIAETESFEKNLTEVRAANITSLGNQPLIVLSRGIWDPLPSVSEAENQQAWQAWQAMQSELAVLSANSKQVIAEQSGHFLQLQQPHLVIEAIREVVQATPE